MRIGIASGSLAVLLGGTAWLVSASALAQGSDVPNAEPPPAAAPAPGAGLAPATTDETAPLPVPTELLRVDPGGLTADQAAARSRDTSWAAKASQEQLRSAAARVDEAWSAFLPRLSGVARYTRLSSFTPPSFGSGSLVGTNAPPGQPITPGEVASGQVGFFPFAFTIPLVLDNYLLQASLTVPISDYLFKIDQTYTAATRSQDAARWDVVTARAQAESNGRLAYYNWLEARGAVIVAVQALDDQKTHLRDARNQFAVGNANKADVLRAETAVASAELALERAKNLADLTEKQLRVAMHAGDDATLVPGENLDAPVPPVQGNLKQMTIEALASRPEVKSADANADAARQQAEAAKAQRWPSLSAFADAIEGNPNPRVFPPVNAQGQSYWFGTWDVGAQLTWTPNDILLANGNVRDIESRVAVIEANKQQTRDNIEVEVTQALQAVHEADFSVESSTRELASAEEAYRVARELFNNGRGTSTTLTDAESDLTRARLDLLNAKVSVRTARIRLDHALGRDVRPPTAP